MLPRFSTICGITEEELNTVMRRDIQELASQMGCSECEMADRLKQMYDGYHFSEDAPGVYNPFSLMKAFQDHKLSQYWFSTGTPTFLIRQMQYFHTDITMMDGIEAPSSAFDRPTEAMDDALPLLYQSGYLTIKGYDRESDIYTLSIPNKEVRVGFVEGLLPAYVGEGAGKVQSGFALKFWRALKRNDVHLALTEMQSYLAGLPYVEGFKKKLAEASTAEGFYEYTLYLIFSMLNVYVQTQVKCRGGRIDMVVYMPDTTYVFELKTSGSPEEALAQIDTNEYAIPYHSEGRTVVKAGLVFDVNARTLKGWKIAD